MPLWKINDKGPSKVKESRFKQEMKTGYFVEEVKG